MRFSMLRTSATLDRANSSSGSLPISLYVDCIYAPVSAWTKSAISKIQTTILFLICDQSLKVDCDAIPVSTRKELIDSSFV